MSKVELSDNVIYSCMFVRLFSSLLQNFAWVNTSYMQAVYFVHVAVCPPVLTGN